MPRPCFIVVQASACRIHVGSASADRLFAKESGIPMPISEELKRTLGKPLGKIPSGVYILTAAHEGKNHAMLVSWVQQAAFDPPALSVAMAKDRPIYPLVRDSSRFALSILGENDAP